jgi:hypothetical protein
MASLYLHQQSCSTLVGAMASKASVQPSAALHSIAQQDFLYCLLTFHAPAAEIPLPKHSINT